MGLARGAAFAVDRPAASCSPPMGYPWITKQPYSSWFWQRSTVKAPGICQACSLSYISNSLTLRSATQHRPMRKRPLPHALWLSRDHSAPTFKVMDLAMPRGQSSTGQAGLPCAGYRPSPFFRRTCTRDERALRGLGRPALNETLLNGVAHQRLHVRGGQHRRLSGPHALWRGV